MEENTTVQTFETLLENFKDDYQKFMEKGNNAASTRARKTLQEIRNLAKDTRDEIQRVKNERKAK